MSKFISRIFGPLKTNTTNLVPETLSPETLIKEAQVNALSDFLDPTCKELIAAAVTESDLAFPTLLYVQISENVAIVTEIEFAKKVGADNLPLVTIKSARKDSGRLFDGDIFVSDEALLDFTDEELETKISAGEIGQGTCFLAKSVISEKAIFGRNCIIGEGAKIFGGVFGDNVVIGRNAWVGHAVELASGVLIGQETSLNGTIKIGFDPDNETGVEPAYVMIGNSCALDSCSIKRRTIIGKHCLVDNNPEFSGLIPNGATVVAQGKSFSVIPY